MAFADTDELALFLAGGLDAGLEAQGQLLLDIATSAIQSYTGQHIELVTDEELTLDAPYGEAVFLPELPVTEISDVTLDGTALTTDDYDFISTGVLYRNNARWWTSSLSGRQKIVVTYTHGYEEIPADIKGVCLSLAARMMEGKNSYSVDSEGNPETASTIARAGIIGDFTDEERAVMDRYRLVTVA